MEVAECMQQRECVVMHRTLTLPEVLGLNYHEGVAKSICFINPSESLSVKPGCFRAQNNEGKDKY